MIHYCGLSKFFETDVKNLGFYIFAGMSEEWRAYILKLLYNSKNLKGRSQKIGLTINTKKAPFPITLT